LPDLSWIEVIVRVVLAAILGGAIGLERELRDREAGLRTHLLVSVGAALFTMVSAYAWTDWRFSTQEGLVFDPTRIAAQVVTGIGFLGAGAIIRQGLSVKGLTTAATLWVVAAIGMAAGVGYYEAALVTTGLVLLTLWPLRILAFRLSSRVRPEEGRVAVELPAGASAVSVLEAVEGLGADIGSLEFEDEGDRRRIDLRIRLGKGRSAAELVDALTHVEDVKGARWNP
jgi:putative Mg2+ transporter-C (MgtC) family protein